MNASFEAAKAAKAEAAKIIGALVGGVAIGSLAVGVMKLANGYFGLKVNLPTEPAKDVKLPEEVEGVPIKVEVVGEIRSQ